MTQPRPRCSASTFGASSFGLVLYCSPISASTTAGSMSSNAPRAPMYMMFLNSWHWGRSSQVALATCVSGTRMTVTSSRNCDFGIDLLDRKNFVTGEEGEDGLDHGGVRFMKKKKIK